MARVNLAQKYGLEEEITIKPQTTDDIINHETVIQAAQDSINSLIENAGNPTERLEQVVAVLEEMSGKVDDLIKRHETSQEPVEATIDEINDVLVKNGLDPVDRNVTVSLAKENIGQKIKDVFRKIWETMVNTFKAVVNFFRNIFNKIFKSGSFDKKYKADESFDRAVAADASKLQNIVITVATSKQKEIFCDFEEAFKDTMEIGKHLIDTHFAYIDKVKNFSTVWQNELKRLDVNADDFEEKFLALVNKAMHHPNVDFNKFLHKAGNDEQQPYDGYFTVYRNEGAYLGYVSMMGVMGEPKPIGTIGESSKFLGNHLKKSKMGFDENPDTVKYEHKIVGYNDYNRLNESFKLLKRHVEMYNARINHSSPDPIKPLDNSIQDKFDEICTKHANLSSVCQKVGMLMMRDTRSIMMNLIEFNKYQMHVMSEGKKFLDMWREAVKQEQHKERTLQDVA